MNGHWRRVVDMGSLWVERIADPFYGNTIGAEEQ